VSRRERKVKRTRRKADILAEVAQVAADAVEHGGDSRDAMLAADRWLLERIRACPQEAQLYRDVAAEYSRLLNAAVKERGRSVRRLMKYLTIFLSCSAGIVLVCTERGMLVWWSVGAWLLAAMLCVIYLRVTREGNHSGATRLS